MAGRSFSGSAPSGTNRVGCGLFVPPGYLRQGVHPQWLFDGTKYRLPVGAGDPEGLLYQSASSRQSIIDALIANGGNLLYALICRDPGDGPGQTPWVLDLPENGLDATLMSEWETFFALCEEAQISIFLFLWDDHQLATPVFGAGDNSPAAEQSYITNIVNEFKHHKNLIWMVSEEYFEGFSVPRCSAQAAVMRAASTDIIIGNHQNEGLVFEFQTDNNIRLFGIQQNETLFNVNGGIAGISADAVTNGYCYAMIENANHGTGTNARKIDWAVFMGGSCAVARLGMDPSTAAASDLADCQRLTNFAESTSFYTMTPNNTLAASGTDYVLANPGKDYIAYAENLIGDIGVSDMTAGIYDAFWQSCDADGQQWETDIAVSSGTNVFTKPPAISAECAVWLRRQ